MSNLIERLLTPLHTRIGDIHLANDAFALVESMDIAAAEAAERIEELERQLERRTVSAALLALEVAARVAETLPSNTGMYLDRRDIAKAIRALSDCSPTLLQEQKDNGGKEGE